MKRGREIHSKYKKRREGWKKLTTIEKDYNRGTVEPPLTASSPQRPLFWADSSYIDSCLNLSTTAIFFCSKVSAVETFNGIWKHVSLTVFQN